MSNFSHTQKVQTYKTKTDITKPKHTLIITESLYPDNYESINQKTKILNLRKIQKGKNSLKIQNSSTLYETPQKKNSNKITEHTKKRHFTQNTHTSSKLTKAKQTLIKPKHNDQILKTIHKNQRPIKKTHISIQIHTHND